MISREMLQDSVIQNMTEGIILIDFMGTIVYVNEAAFTILAMSEEEITGQKFAAVFLRDPRNDDFTQAVLDVIYQRKQPEPVIVSYMAGETRKDLRVAASYLRDEIGDPAGLTIVLADLSELMELKDAVRAMEYIGELNRQLEARNQILSSTFGMFLSDEIVHELLSTPGGLVPGGKKRMLTVMMSDLRGFTAISERMDAGDLISMLNHYLGAMTEIIQKRGGTIIEFIGDGILAIFGAPAVSNTHASDAVAAALEMEAAMTEINLWNSERDYPLLEMGIGIDTGEVIIGNIGSEKRMKYGVVGQHVNLCGRIESYTVGGQILISPDTKREIGVSLQVAREMTVLPKGTDKEMVLSHITGIGEPYGIYIAETNDALSELPCPIPVCFYQLDGKHTLERSCFGGLVSVGSGSAVLDTETPLKVFDNIQIKAGGRLTCKVMGIKDSQCLLQYTSIPSGYDEWIRAAKAGA